MTLDMILADCYRRTGFDANPDAKVTTRFLGFLNETHHQLLSLPGMEQLRRSTLTFASVASQSQYAMPPIVGRVLSVVDAANRVPLGSQSWSWYRNTDPDPSSITGTPEAYIPYGLSAVSKQPADASQVWVDSTSASDTGVCYTEGFRTGGYAFSAATTMNGVTAVQIGSYTDIIEITKFYLGTTAVGDVTLNENASGGTELGKIPIGSTFARFWTMALWPTPASALTYTIDCDRIVPEMLTPNDQPLLPEDFHYLLPIGVRMKEYEKQDDTRYSVAAREWARGVSDLKWRLIGNPVVNNRVAQPPSRLGAWYPAGT
jgi:hypothetical protein